MPHMTPAAQAVFDDCITLTEGQCVACDPVDIWADGALTIDRRAQVLTVIINMVPPVLVFKADYTVPSDGAFVALTLHRFNSGEWVGYLAEEARKVRVVELADPFSGVDDTRFIGAHAEPS